MQFSYAFKVGSECLLQASISCISYRTAVYMQRYAYMYTKYNSCVAYFAGDEWACNNLGMGWCWGFAVDWLLPCLLGFSTSINYVAKQTFYSRTCPNPIADESPIAPPFSPLTPPSHTRDSQGNIIRTYWTQQDQTVTKKLLEKVFAFFRRNGTWLWPLL